MLRNGFCAKWGSLVAVVVCLLGMMLSSPVMGQTAGTGAITGIVTDATGASVPNATVTATNPATGQSRTATTGGDGSYEISLLTPGNYRVKFEASGFETVEVPSVTVTVTETGTLNRVMTVGSQTQEVTIQADVETVNTSNASVGAVMNSAAVVDLPLTTRNYQNLIGFSPGANAPVADATALGKNTVATAVNGATTAQNNFQLDGAGVNNILSFGAGQEGGFYGAQGIPSPDAIAEFKIQTSTYDAGYGRNPGANVNVVTKSGTNDWHGTAFEFFRNTVLNANTFFFNLSKKPEGALDQNQYGGVLGGPIIKNKFFIFGSYQKTWQKNGIASTGASTVLLPPIPTGDRGTCPVGWTVLTQCDPAAQTFVPALGAAICPANQGTPANPTPARKFDVTTLTGGLNVACDGSNINPVAVKILQLKLPNGQYYIPSSGANFQAAYPVQTFSIPSYYKEYQGLLNTDYVINSKNTFSERFFMGTDPVTAPFAAAVALPGSGYTSQYTNIETLLRLTTIVTPNLVNEVRGSYQRNVSNLNTQGQFTASEVGMTPNATADPVLPFIQISGLFTFGTDGFDLYYQAVNQFQIADQLSWTHGKHTVRTGVEWEKDQANNFVTGLAVGQPVIGSFPDFLIGRAAGPVAGGGNGTALSNIVGPDNNHTTNVVADGGNFGHYYRISDWSVFLQDDWKISSRLTVNLGLRWEYDGLPWDVNGAFSSIWPNLVQAAGIPGTTVATGSLQGFVVPSNYFGFQPAGVVRNSIKQGTQNNAALDNFAPRVGFAWQPLSSKPGLVIRAGAGYFYDRSSFAAQQVLYNAQPFEISPSASPTTTLANPFFVPATVPAPPGIGFTPRFINFGATPNATSGANSNVGNPSVAQKWYTPTQYEWNLDLQYEFIRNWVFQLGYVGSRGLHEPYTTTFTSVSYYNVAPLASPTNPIHCGYDGNPADCITGNTTANVPNRVPNLGISSQADIAGTLGDYKFNSIQASVRKNLSRGLTFQAAYTYSRSFVTQVYGIPSLSQGSTVCCLLNPQGVYGLNPVYRPNRFIATYNYQLPFHADGVKGKLVDGWSLSGVTTIQGGAPITPTDSRGGAVYGFAGVAVSLAQYCPGMGPANIGTSGSTYTRVLGHYLNNIPQGTAGAAFCSPLPAGGGTSLGFGDGGIATILGPAQDSWDMSLAKLTTVGGIREDGTLEFRTEFYNAFNHPQFGLPTANVNSGAFGKITTTVVNPRLIQFGLKYSF